MVNLCQSIYSMFAYIYPPKTPQLCRQKRPALIEESGDSYQKMKQHNDALVPGFSLPFRSMDISCLLMRRKSWWIWRFYWLERQVCHSFPKWMHAAGARSNTRAWLYLGTAAVLKRLGGGNSNIFSIFNPNWGDDPIWRIFFQRGWNHQLEDFDFSTWMILWLYVLYFCISSFFFERFAKETRATNWVSFKLSGY